MNIKKEMQKAFKENREETLQWLRSKKYEDYLQKFSRP